ncbi:MAG: hypothetical protein DHS20C14_13170 [Phycisphaeraceae bacterium]|nr:MAG: hypothetical protein DHS20C14_13170 [Phycisphaeraceae bacterium]
MTPVGNDLLTLLGSGIRPAGVDSAGASSRGAGAAAQADGPGFAALLHAARAGELGSGMPVEIEPALRLELTEEQTARLEKAADRATSEGADRAVVVLDGKALVLDVEGRRVIDAKAIDEIGALTNIDAVIGAAVPKEDDAAIGLGGLMLAPAAGLARALGLTGTTSEA